VILSGLPSGSTLPKGRLSATGGWQLSADELADCAIRPAQGFVGALRNGSLTDVSDAGHMVAGDRNDVFMDAVVAFLGRQDETPLAAG